VSKTHYPLLFGYRDPIFGRGYLAGVATEGRGLLVDEGDDGWWMYGVNPGGLAAGGQTKEEAIASFREMYNAVLFDIAEEVADFGAFQAAVHEFFEEANEPYLEEWEAATEEARDKKSSADWLPTRQKQVAKRSVKVVLLREMKPEINDRLQPEPTSVAVA